MSIVGSKIVAPVNAEDPFRLLGVGTVNGGFDVGYICDNINHKKINEGSLIKPVRSTKYTELTYIDFREFNYGYRIIPNSQLSDAIVDSKYMFFYMSKASKEYPGRLTDFNGYDHAKVNPFSLSVPRYVHVGKFCKCKFERDLMEIILWEAWREYYNEVSGDINLHVGFYVNKVGYYPITSNGFGDKKYRELTNDDLKFPLTKGIIYDSYQYEVALVLTTWNAINGVGTWYDKIDNLAGYKWWVFPTIGNSKFTTTLEPQPNDYLTITGNAFYTSKKVDDYYSITNIRLNLSIKVAADYPYVFPESTRSFLNVDIIKENARLDNISTGDYEFRTINSGEISRNQTITLTNELIGGCNINNFEYRTVNNQQMPFITITIKTRIIIGFNTYAERSFVTGIESVG